MKLLITGALGHIGSYVINDLARIKKIKKIYLIDNLSNERFNVLFSIKNKKVTFIYGDLKNISDVKRIPKADIVLHLASTTNAEKSFENKDYLFKNNLGSFKNITNYCKKFKSKLIHISSTSVYGPQKNIVDEEQKRLFPRSPYAIVKIKEENILKRQKKFKYISLRFGTISGYSLGMRFHTAVNKFCLNAVLGINIPVWGKSINLYRPYLSLTDALRVFKFLIIKNFFPCEIFNVLSENKTISEILKTIKKNNLNPKINFVKSRILNQDSYKISNEKIKKIGVKLNAKISKDINDTIRRIKVN